LKLKLIYNRQSVGQSVLVLGSYLGAMTRFILSLWRLQVSWCGTPSLTGGWVCNLLVQLLLGLARVVALESKSRRTHGHILLSHMRLPHPGRPGPRIYIPQKQGGPVIPPGTCFLSMLMWFYCFIVVSEIVLLLWYSQCSCSIRCQKFGFRHRISSRSVAEETFVCMFHGVRFLHETHQLLLYCTELCKVYRYVNIVHVFLFHGCNLPDWTN
jgi:hypothetical protein